MGPLSGRGKPDLWTVHDERIYIFASEACRSGFLKATDRYADRELPWSEPKATDQAKGEALMRAAREAHGLGEESTGALRLTAKGESSGWENERTLVLGADGQVMRRSKWIPPDTDTKGYDTRWIVAGKRSLVDEDGKRWPLSAAEVKDVRRFAHRDPLAILWNYRRGKVAAVGTKKLGKMETVAVAVHYDGMTALVHLDPKDHRIAGISWRGRAGGGVVHDVVETFGEWVKTGGLLVPLSRRVEADGKEIVSWSVPWDKAELLKVRPATK